MKWFLDLPTKAKLTLAFGLQFLLLALLVFLAYSGLESIRRVQDHVTGTEFQKLNLLDNIRSDLNRLRSQEAELPLMDKQDERAALERSMQEKAALLVAEMDGLSEFGRDDAMLSESLKGIRNMYEEIASTRARIMELLAAGKDAEMRELTLGVQNVRNERIRTTALDLDKRIKDEVKIAVEDSQRKISKYLSLFLLIGAISLVAAIMVVALLNGAIATPLNRVTVIAARMAVGDLTVNLPAGDRADEVGRLQAAFRDMVDRLRGMISDVGATINVLSSTSSEIMATTAQVAGGASETATAVSQTSTTVEEVKQTAHVASQKAKSVSESAQRATHVAMGGRKSVEQSIEAMSDIREQMEMVAESTVKLSERSASIGEIIETVNDLAEQSNILAVNASIEAAKAGDAGRGFGVVAQEIRSLAEQSKQATTQVRTLLNEVQKGIGSAVMATEQVSRVIEGGLKQSEEMQQSFRALSDTVAESAQAAIQIAASSQQQLAGMDQVASAMDGIRQASAQNLAGTKQSEASAQGLHKLGQALKATVGRYKI